MDVNKSPFSIGMLTWIKSLTQVNGTQCRTQMWHVWPINHRALWFFTFINYRSEGKYCTAPWPFIHQSSLHAELKAEGDRSEQNDTFWKGGRLNEPWQQSTFRFLKRLSSLPLSMSCPHFTCSVQRNVHAYKKKKPISMQFAACRQAGAPAAVWARRQYPACSSYLGRLHNQPSWIM